MRVKIKGKSWLVRQAILEAKSHVGECTWSERLIEIAPGQGPRQLLNTIIHETAHAVNWRWSEKTVREIAKAVTSVLWKTGYRRKGKMK
jgi:hypothetical protein